MLHRAQAGDSSASPQRASRPSGPCSRASRAGSRAFRWLTTEPDRALRGPNVELGVRPTRTCASRFMPRAAIARLVFAPRLRRRRRDRRRRAATFVEDHGLPGLLRRLLRRLPSAFLTAMSLPKSSCSSTSSPPLPVAASVWPPLLGRLWRRRGLESSSSASRPPTSCLCSTVSRLQLLRQCAAPPVVREVALRVGARQLAQVGLAGPSIAWPRGRGGRGCSAPAAAAAASRRPAADGVANARGSPVEVALPPAPAHARSDRRKRATARAAASAVPGRGERFCLRGEHCLRRVRTFASK